MEKNKMIAKKFAIGFGIAIILPMMIHYGVSTFSPAPKWEDYRIEPRYFNYSAATPEENAKRAAEEQKIEDARKAHEKRFAKSLFIVATPVGLLAIILGSVIVVQAVGSGLIFGGIFTLMDGYLCYWSELSDVLRFISLLVAFVILIWIGYRKLGKSTSD